MLHKCYVGGCKSTSETHRVFCFPKNDYLRNLWVSFIAPTKPHIIALSKEQLLRKRVCEKHFDKYQMDEEGKRLRYSYPCLFTDEEIALGEPFSAPEAGHDILRDHNYCKEQNDDEDLTDTAMVVGRADGVENNHDQLESELVKQSELVVEMTVTKSTTTSKDQNLYISL